MLICAGHCSFFNFPGSLGSKSLYKTYACPCRVVFKSFLPFLVIRDAQNIPLICNDLIKGGRTAEFCILFWLYYGDFYFLSANLPFPGRELTGAWLFSMQFALSNDCICNCLPFRSLRHSVYKDLLCKFTVRQLPLAVLWNLRVGQGADIGGIMQDHGKPFDPKPEVHYRAWNIIFCKGCWGVYTESCNLDPAVRVLGV